MKNLSAAPSFESDDFPDRFSDTWDRRSSITDAGTVNSDQPHGHSLGLLGQLQRRLPCNRCWTSLIASAAITTFIVGGVLLIVALLVRHHDEQMEKLEQSLGVGTSPGPIVADGLLITKKVIESTLATKAPNQTINPDANLCLSQPCLNGGTCLHNETFAHCACPPKYGGRLCADALTTSTSTTTTKPTTTTPDPFCLTHSCANAGVCNSELRECQCQINFGGRFCQNPSKGICASSPCLYDAPCTDINGGLDYKCTCPIGFDGKRCEIVACGSNVTLTATPSMATYSSPDYPNDRLPFLNCSWSITARFYFIKLSLENIYLQGDSCTDSHLDFYDNATRVLIKRFCPSNISGITFETHGSRSILISYTAQVGSYFRISYTSPNIDPCYYFNKAYCMHGKCWPDETKATCVCDPCYRGVGCSENDDGDCDGTYCANNGTCVYNCYVQIKRCMCTNGFDPKTNCQKKCTDINFC